MSDSMYVSLVTLFSSPSDTLKKLTVVNKWGQSHGPGPETVHEDEERDVSMTPVMNLIGQKFHSKDESQ